eukprot:9977774-Lingulodinium_polyedra.AAC.1
MQSHGVNAIHAIYCHSWSQIARAFRAHTEIGVRTVREACDLRAVVAAGGRFDRIIVHSF